ncbi:hypothetical protein L3X38_024623 [Prunus dulcis]|uniref:Uncharacterized protein n=1 Tax=Prunus dulcis TaxID=3755 RepID=A0AAD4W080_PRUDU|nr:hypothetical protein L3X38_024623 [Prunus dulcis]
MSPLRKNPKIPSAEKTQVGSVPSSSTRVKHLVGADSRKVGGTSSARDVLLKPPTDKLENLHTRGRYHGQRQTLPLKCEF